MSDEMKKENHDCNCKCSFEGIIPKIMKFGTGQLIAFIAIALFFIMSSFPDEAFRSFYLFLHQFSQFTFTLFLIMYFAEKFTCFESKRLKLINTILLGLATISGMIFIIKIWSYHFNRESLVLFILILGANAYWAYDLIMGFVANKKEAAAKAEAEQAKTAEEPYKEEEKPEEKEESEDKSEETEEKSEEENKED